MEYQVYLPPFDYDLGKDRLYGVWRGMLMRCYNPNATNYHRYGGRGIGVCDEWRLDFHAFKSWAMEAGYDYTKSRKEQTIDRTNNNGNYEPSNCRWVSAAENNRNRERSGRIPKPKPPRQKRERVTWEINGVSKYASDWCREYGMDYTTVMNRVKKQGMMPLEALTAPKMKYPHAKYEWRRLCSSKTR